jgi:sporulation and spore germination protein
MTVRSTWLAIALGLVLLAPAGPAAAAPAAARERVVVPTLTSVQAQHVGKVDRVTFGFANGLPDHVYPQWVDTLVHDGSGLPVRVAGAAILSVGFTSAIAHDQDGATIATRTAYPLPNVITAVSAGDFEGYVTVGLGLQKRTSYKVTKLTNPDRVVVDVRAGFATTTRKVWFVDTDAANTGDEPFFVPRSRTVPSAAPAAGALHALFAGPTPSERAGGLQLVTSRAWGFDDLQVSGGIARVRLTHGCNSNGSTLTIAGEVMPTLRQFPTVDWVKIYAPGGATEQPSGQVDSIPACLEP